MEEQGWKLRKCLGAFSRAAKRPHWPRNRAMQQLFAAAGIMPPQRNLIASAGDFASCMRAYRLMKSLSRRHGRQS